MSLRITNLDTSGLVHFSWQGKCWRMSFESGSLPREIEIAEGMLQQALEATVERQLELGFTGDMEEVECPPSPKFPWILGATVAFVAWHLSTKR